ncbi:MAG TPA: hypothetical protein VHX66_16580 [Solirubrobacteraceae bacterium]|jgi:hypothetical protein|nr:hypothetical protein [Solirubrobacteraceae bacterium]
MSARPDSHFPGDDLVADANMIFDRRLLIAATPERIWPWLVQLGKHRAGWYLPRRIEVVIPRDRRASRAVLAAHQNLEVDQRIPDYGGRRAWLEVAAIEAPRALVYRTERRGTPFSWALLLTPRAADETELHLRFRARLKSGGVRRRAITILGDAADAVTTVLLVRGLRERLAEKQRRDEPEPR